MGADPPASLAYFLDPPYSGQDAPLLFGRERYTTFVIPNILALRLTLLYNESGVGGRLARKTPRVWGGDTVRSLPLGKPASGGLPPDDVYFEKTCSSAARTVAAAELAVVQSVFARGSASCSPA